MTDESWFHPKIPLERTMHVGTEKRESAPVVVYIVTNAVSCAFLRGQVGYLQNLGYTVVVISSPGQGLDYLSETEEVRVVPVKMEREIRPLRDLISLWQLWRTLRRLRPTIVNASTPKAGLLSMLAAWLLRVPVRVYVVRGLRLETARGLKRFTLGMTERITARCASRIVCVSESLRQLFVQLGFSKKEKTIVYCSGSSNGIDWEAFESHSDPSRGSDIRRQLGIPNDSPVIGFVGRLVRDKGVSELIDAFELVQQDIPKARLLLLGGMEPGDPVSQDAAQRLHDNPAVIMQGWVENVLPYYSAMDLLAFPTYREGFPNVPLEAGISRIPVVGFRATGVVDAVVDGETGILVPLGDSDQLAEAMVRYIKDPTMRKQHGEAARERVLKYFRREDIWNALHQEYLRLLQAKGLPLPQPITDDVDESLESIESVSAAK